MSLSVVSDKGRLRTIGRPEAVQYPIKENSVRESSIMDSNGRGPFTGGRQEQASKSNQVGARMLRGLVAEMGELKALVAIAESFKGVGTVRTPVGTVEPRGER
jgi:hypothetical protein